MKTIETIAIQLLWNQQIGQGSENQNNNAKIVADENPEKQTNENPHNLSLEQIEKEKRKNKTK